MSTASDPFEPHALVSYGDEDSRLRGFALYVGMSESKARENGLDLGSVVRALREAVSRRLPVAECEAHTVVAVADATVRDLEVVIRASGRTFVPEAPNSPAAAPVSAGNVVIDLARHRVLIGEQDVRLTFQEFALLQRLVDHPGRTISRETLRGATVDGIDLDGAEVNDRTIDVRIRRLRVKLGEYSDLIRTVPGRGYRFDERPDVAVRSA